MKHSIALLLLIGSPSIMAAEFMVPARQRQLFVDDHGVAKIAGLTRRMHVPRKLGAVIRPVVKDKMVSLQTRSGPAWDPQSKIYKLWLISADCYQSRDGLHWTPTSKRPNRAVLSVVRDPHDPDPRYRYKGLVIQRSVRIPVGSPDGLSWTKIPGAKNVPSQDESNLSYDAQKKLFIATVKHRGPYGRSVYLSTSKDFRTWTKPRLIFHADKQDQVLGRKNILARINNKSLLPMFHVDPKVFNVQVYNMGVFRYEGVYFGTPAMFHSTGPVPNYPNTDGFHLIGLVTSRDLLKWQRLGNRRPFIGPSSINSGAYDLTQLIGPSFPVVRGDELWFYYTSLKYRATFNYVGKFPNGKHVIKPELDKDAGAISLAILRRDGFVSLDAGDQPGTVVTQPFRMSSDQLSVNVDAVKGRLVVSAHGEGGALVARSKALVGNHPRGKVVWESGGDKLRNKKIVSLKFTLTNASLYSYWLD